MNAGQTAQNICTVCRKTLFLQADTTKQEDNKAEDENEKLSQQSEQLSQQEAQLQEKNSLLAQQTAKMRILAQRLTASGLTLEEISQMTGISIDELQSG